MNERLLLALDRGGIAIRLKDDTWGIWRGRDQRGRRVGTLSGAEISAQVALGHLSHLGEPSEQRLIWTGPPLPRQQAEPSAKAVSYTHLTLPTIA